MIWFVPEYPRDLREPRVPSIVAVVAWISGRFEIVRQRRFCGVVQEQADRGEGASGGLLGLRWGHFQGETVQGWREKRLAKIASFPTGGLYHPLIEHFSEESTPGLPTPKHVPPYQLVFKHDWVFSSQAPCLTTVCVADCVRVCGVSPSFPWGSRFQGIRGRFSPSLQPLQFPSTQVRRSGLGASDIFQPG